MAETLLRHLATRRAAGDLPPVRYDPDSQTSQVFEDGMWVPTWESRSIENTKKCDAETGEDQKGT